MGTTEAVSLFEIILPDDGSKKYFNTRNNIMEEVQYCVSITYCYHKP
jgi:hypothetical protein